VSYRTERLYVAMCAAIVILHLGAVAVNGALAAGSEASLQAALENPQAFSAQSGIGLVSGWVCSADRVTFQVDSGPVAEAAYGTSRADTVAVCGDANNGFGALLNWNLLGDGAHTLRAFADGVEFGSATFTVTTVGGSFLRGASGQYLLSDFPSSGKSVVVRWQEAAQNFVIGAASEGASEAVGAEPREAAAVSGVLENPAPSSYQSGIGVISGWVCSADAVTIKIDNRTPIDAAYGTSRNDTASICGDSNNGFGVLLNWNLLGDGVHTIVAMADGAELGRSTFTVTTLGKPFLQGLQARYELPNFPGEGQSVVVDWSTAAQNFVITEMRTEDPVCGDGRREGDEECDGTDFGGLSCQDYDPTALGGALSCSLGCKVTLGQCVFNICGDGILQPPYEQCDGSICPDLNNAQAVDFSCTCECINNCQTQIISCEI